MADYIITFQDGSEVYLAHHGIKGQKWGVRRYQNEDGSYTNLGRQHRADIQGQTYDHDKSDTKARTYALTKTALDILFLNPVSLVSDVSRLATAGHANSLEKQAERRKAREPIDEKSGFHVSKKKLTSEENAKLVNPGFKNFDENTKNNCVLCSLTLEMRNRGLDVTANKAIDGYNLGETLKDMFPKAKYKSSYDSSPELKKMLSDRTKFEKKFISKYSDPNTGNIDYTSFFKDPDYSKYTDLCREITNVANPQKTELVSKTIDTIKSQGDGARGVLSVEWVGYKTGHAVGYEVKNGEFRIIDAQNGKTTNEKASKKMLIKKCDSCIQYARLDDQEPNYARLKEIMN